MNQRIKEYKIVKATDLPGLESEVNKATKEGWVPCGGVCVSIVPQAKPQPAIVFLQSMVQYEQ
jgi:hypothetical protein